MLHRTSTAFLLVTMLLQTTKAQDDLLHFLIEQNAAAREKIKTAEYKVKWTQSLVVREGVRHNEGTGEVKLKGPWRRSTQECNASIPAAGWQQKQTPSIVINDRYVGYWPDVGNGNVYRDDHQSLKGLSPDVQLRYALHTTPDLYVFAVAFGGEKDTTFKEMRKLHPDQIRWTAEEVKQPNGGSVYQIKRYSPFTTDPQGPGAVWTIDPQRGFMVTQAVFYSRSGNMWITRTIDAKEVDNGVWIPVAYRELRYGNPDDEHPADKPEETTVQVEDVVVNREIADDYFQVESLLPDKYKASTNLYHKRLDGRTDVYTYRNGGYVLRAIADDVDEVLADAVPVMDGDSGIAVNGERLASQDRQRHTTDGNEVSLGEVGMPPIAESHDRWLVYVLLGVGLIIVLLFFATYGKAVFRRRK